MSAHAQLNACTILHDAPIPATSNVQQELSIVFHQDWRQQLAEGSVRTVAGGRVVYFYSNGSATANRGAEVRELRALSSLICQLVLLQVIHQLHRAVLDCGIESYIEKVLTSAMFLSLLNMPLHASPPHIICLQPYQPYCDALGGCRVIEAGDTTVFNRLTAGCSHVMRFRVLLFLTSPRS